MVDTIILETVLKRVENIALITFFKKFKQNFIIGDVRVPKFIFIQ